MEDGGFDEVGVLSQVGRGEGERGAVVLHRLRDDVFVSSQLRRHCLKRVPPLSHRPKCESFVRSQWLVKEILSIEMGMIAYVKTKVMPIQTLDESPPYHARNRCSFAPEPGAIYPKVKNTNPCIWRLRTAYREGSLGWSAACWWFVCSRFFCSENPTWFNGNIVIS